MISPGFIETSGAQGMIDAAIGRRQTTENEGTHHETARQ